MAENINKSKGTIFKKRKNMSAAEYVDFLLQSNTPIEVIEEIIKEKEIKSAENIQKLQNDNSTEELQTEERKLRGYQAILKEIKRRNLIANQVDTIILDFEKLKKTYEDSIEKSTKLCEYIDELKISEIKDYSSTINMISTKIKDCTKQFDIQYKITMETYEKIGELREISPEYELFEKYANSVPKFEGKEREYVKEKCINAMKKIKELQELNTKEKTPIYHDRKEQIKLINQLESYIDDVLPKMLSDSKEFEFIKAEAIKEVGLEVKKPNIEDVPTVITADDSTKIDDDTAITETSSDNKGATEEPVKSGTTEPAKSAIDNVGTPEFNEVKQEYINAITIINNNIKDINDFNTDQENYAMDPQRYYGQMIFVENEVLKCQTRIENIKSTMRELEYQKFVEENIVLSLDEDIVKLPKEEIYYNGSLDSYVRSHNSVIEGCYAELQAISAQPNYKENEATQQRVNLLLQVIDAQHSIIDRRLIHERKLNRDFDMVEYMRNHRVNSKNPVLSTKLNDSVVTIDQTQIDENAVIADIDNKLIVYKQNMEVLTKRRYNMLVKMGGFVDMAEQSIEIGGQIIAFDEAIENSINNSNLSEETKKKKLEEYKNIAASLEKTIKEECLTENGSEYEFDIIELNRKLAELKIISNKLVEMSSKPEDIEVYAAAKEKFLLLAKEIKEEYKEYGIKFTIDSLTNNIVISIPDKKNPKGRSNFSFGTLTKEQEKKVVKATTIDVKEAKLNFNRKVQKTRKENIIETTTPLKVSLLKNSIKVSYTKKMLEELKNMKLKLEIVAGAANDGKINVTEGKDSKDGLKEYRYISNPTDLTEAKIVYKDIETEQEVMSMDILNNEEIAEVIAERRKLR